jgi:hypothetical protein
LASSIAIVIGPTPPGTGVIQDARSAQDAKSTSPTSFPSGRRLMPTSITIAPGLIHAPGTKPALPTPATTMSAWPTMPGRSRVAEWQIVTVQRAINSSSAIGRPTMVDCPITTACLPTRSSPVSARSRMQPQGVQGRKVGRLSTSRPMLIGWNPSTSFAGSMRSVTRSGSMCGGSGSWTRIPDTVGSAFRRSISASNSASGTVAAKSWA